MYGNTIPNGFNMKDIDYDVWSTRLKYGSKKTEKLLFDGVMLFESRRVSTRMYFTTFSSGIICLHANIEEKLNEIAIFVIIVN